MAGEFLNMPTDLPDDGATGARRKVLLGEHRLATETIGVPPERPVIAEIQALRKYEGWEAVDEAREFGLLRQMVRHSELSPTFRCPEDCVGCPDRASMHRGDGPEKDMSPEQWLDVVDILSSEHGVEYFMLIGGTIEGHPATPVLMNKIANDPRIDGGWFTDGIMLHDWRTGSLKPRYDKLMASGMGELTTHVSADYLVPQGVEAHGPLLDPRERWENAYGGSRWYKSAYGLRTAHDMINANAKRVVLNTAVSAHNIEEVLPIYEHAKLLQDRAQYFGKRTVVLYSLSPWQWRAHLARGDNPGNYPLETLLRDEHRERLQEIADYLIRDTQHRLAEGLPRVAANSIGYLAGLAEHGVTQEVPFTHPSGEFAVEPNGLVRMDPVFVSARAQQLANSSYGYRDRDIDHPPFKHFAEGLPGPHFPNLIQSTKNPDVAWR